MDHIRFLETFRTITCKVRDIEAAHHGHALEWRWKYTPVIRPESVCAFCKGIIQSNGIWFFDRYPRYSRLVGLVELDNPKYQLVRPGHPHLLHPSGELCLGTYPDGISLLGSAANLRDCPMGVYMLPSWYATYWNHPRCSQGQAYLTERGMRDQLVPAESARRNYIVYNDERP